MPGPRALLLVAIATFALLAAGCGDSGGDAAPTTVPAGAVALVGDVPIERSELAAMVAATRASYRLKGQDFPNPGSPDYRTARNKVLDGLVRLTEYEATADSDLGIEINDEDVGQEIERLERLNGGSKKQFDRRLAQQGTTRAQLAVRIREQLLAQAVFEKLSSQVTVSDEDVDAYYEKHRKGYEHPATRQVRQILVRTRAQADSIVRKLRAGADFATLAGKYSIDTSSADRGGRIAGGLTRSETLPAIAQVAFSIATNTVSAPVATQYGWHLIQPTADVVPANVTPLDEVAPVIRTQLLQEKKQKAMAAWVKDVNADYATKVHYAAGYGTAKAAVQGG